MFSRPFDIARQQQPLTVRNRDTQYTGSIVALVCIAHERVQHQAINDF